jgi:hypothetical protein
LIAEQPLPRRDRAWIVAGVPLAELVDRRLITAVARVPFGVVFVTLKHFFHFRRDRLHDRRLLLK